MSKELIVSSGRHETRVAILEDDQVVELFHEREKEYSLAGSIHKGRVTRVLPGMQSAFVDIGLDRDAFLYVSDFFEDNEEYDAVVSTVEEKVLKMERGGSAGIIPAVDPVPAGAEHVNGGAAAVSTNSAASVPAAGALDAPNEQRPEGGRDGRGDRGGRGRRGRRRRGGRGSSLPDSKFFSPKTEVAGPGETESENEGESEPVPASTSRFDRGPSQSGDDLMVLPGESLAKYSPEDTEEVEQAPQVESALPGEHPLAGFGEVAGWVTSTAVEEPVVEEKAEEAIAEILTPVSSGDDEGISAAEVAE